jgi:hypothetical protein
MMFEQAGVANIRERKEANEGRAMRELQKRQEEEKRKREEDKKQ